MAEVPQEVRARLALALDVDDMVVALRLARQVGPWFGVAKVGLELFTAAGPDAVSALIESGFDVFVDLKLHDIPTTVERSAKVLGALGVTYVTLHPSRGSGAEGRRRARHRPAGDPRRRPRQGCRRHRRVARLSLRLQRVAVPRAEIGGGLVGALEERQEVGVGFGRLAHGRVGEHEL